MIMVAVKKERERETVIKTLLPRHNITGSYRVAPVPTVTEMECGSQIREDPGTAATTDPTPGRP